MNVKVAVGIIVGIAIIVGIGYGVSNQNSEPADDIEVPIEDNTETAIDTQGKQFRLELNAEQIEPVKVEGDLSVVAIIGENMRYQPGIASRLFQALGKNGINCIGRARFCRLAS